jgi:hypothetical protein
MLNVRFPHEDIGKEFPKGVISTAFDFYVKDSNTIIYSFLHSSNIYELTLSDNSAKQIASFDGFVFNNYPMSKDKSIVRADFFAPVFTLIEQVYVRGIYVREYKNFKPFRISQILDEKMKLIGYSFGVGSWSNVVINRDGHLIVRNKDDGFFSYYCTITDVNKLKIEDAENQFLERKPIVNRTKISEQMESTSFEVRMKLYLEALQLSESLTVVLISTDVLCGHCIDFLMKQFQMNVEKFKKQKISYVFWGNDLSTMASVLSNYRINLGDIELDFDGLYSEFLHPKELGQYSFVLNDGDNLQFHKSELNNLVQDFEKYVGFEKE